MTPTFAVTESMWLAVISGVLAIAGLVVKHMLDKNSRRIDEAKVDIAATKSLVVDLITWASTLEAHITEGKPPPPPARPESVIDFFTMTFMERHRDPPYEPPPPPPWWRRRRGRRRRHINEESKESA